jgi:CubicO group peptidase (beta-lactamase class C family)
VGIAVAVDGEIVWEDGFGYADLEHRLGVRPETRFRIASISKSLTAAAVGRLWEQGRLDLDAPVQRYVPGFPEKEYPITTRQLAGHLAGIRHYRGDEFMSRKQYDDVVDALVIFRDDPLQSRPGDEYSYSTYGWNLVAAVVQGAAGEPFLQYMRRTVLEPLGMRGTVAEHVDSIIPDRASFYERGQDGRLLNAPYVNNSNKWAGGGYVAPARDLAVYGSAYLRNDFLAPGTVALLWESQHTSSGEATGYGIGWRTGERDGRREIWHTGGAMGGSGVLMIHPDEGVVVAVLTNIGGAPTTAIARPVADLFIEAAGR